MTETLKISELSDFDPAEYLDDEEAIAEYLTAILEENDPVRSRPGGCGPRAWHG